jgi:hypothetical protein
MVFPHRPVGFADGAAPIPVCGLDLIKSLKPDHARRVRDKVAAGASPAAHAALEHEREPGWFPLRASGDEDGTY